MKRLKMSRIITFRVTEKDWVEIERAAAESDETPNEWCRTTTLETARMPIVSFYRAMESNPGHLGGKKAKPVQEAALRLMKDQRYRHPFYWAGFRFVGSNH